MNLHARVSRQFGSLLIGSLLILALAVLAAGPSAADDKPYKEGTVWTVGFVRVKNGLFDVYMRDILPLRRKIDEEARKQGLLLSSHVLTGPAVGRDDFDVMFLEEYKNMAALDGLDEKYDAISEKVIGGEDKQTQLMVKRSEVRELLGDKIMRELIAR